MDCLVDTNILIYTLNGALNPSRFEPVSWYYFFISEVEILGKPRLHASDIQTIKELLNTCTPALFNPKLVPLASDLRREYRLKTPDALIAAASIFYDLPLMTSDKDFPGVDPLSLIMIEF